MFTRTTRAKARGKARVHASDDAPVHVDTLVGIGLFLSSTR
ncbi:hypothetical protein [Polyangium fumosum]|nr:hypothetical protein [Polyangium fumosum]